MAATSIESGTSTLRHHECVGRAAAAVAAKPAGLEIALESQDTGDAAGDPANMVAGSLESKLAAETVTCEISLTSTARVEGPRDLIEQGVSVAKRCFAPPFGKPWGGTSSRNMERRLFYTFGGCTNGWAAQ